MAPILVASSPAPSRQLLLSCEAPFSAIRSPQAATNPGILRSTRLDRNSLPGGKYYLCPPARAAARCSKLLCASARCGNRDVQTGISQRVVDGKTKRQVDTFFPPGGSGGGEREDDTGRVGSRWLPALKNLLPSFENFSPGSSKSSSSLLVALSLAVVLWTNPMLPAGAADALKVCKCLLKECRAELAGCLADVKCAANIACLQGCNGKPDEIECQLRCGDLFENKAVDRFNTCAVTEKKCVPQKEDEGLYPVPPDDALVSEFDVSKFNGTWYIASGLNPSFDTFDCQAHDFTSPSPGVLKGNLTWRVGTPDGGFFTRKAVQVFKQDPGKGGVLYNHDNEMLHYQDDWYILDARMEDSDEDFVLVYYKGSNDAWDGYGGAVVYTRSRTLPDSSKPRLQAALKKVNLSLDQFVSTDNRCGVALPLYARVEKKVEEGVVNLEREVEKEVELLEKGVEKLEEVEFALLGNLGRGFQEVQKDGGRLLEKLTEPERRLLGQMEEMNMGAPEDLEDLFSNPLVLRKRR